MTFERLWTQNYRGQRVPRILGFWLLGCLGLVTLALALAPGDLRLRDGGWASLAGSLLVFGAGLVDDLVPGGPRGLRGHLVALASGRLTTGILKLFVILAVSVVVVAAEPQRPGWVRLVGLVLIAGSTNLWNGLDVAPARALKAFLVVDAFLVLTVPWSLAPGVAGLLVASPPALVWDLQERAMLGDAGANLLGFTVGLGLYLAAPGWGVALAAVLVLTLNVLADSVSLSRLISAMRPLRWFDDLGRRRPETGGPRRR
jgi:hypothetical protein